MNRFTLTVVLTCAVVIAFAQDSTQLSRFYIGGSFSPDLAYRTLIGSGEVSAAGLPEGGIHNEIALRNEYEQPKLGYTGGLTFGAYLKNWVAIDIGISYSNAGFELQRTYPRSGQFPKSTISETETYRFLNIPLTVQFKTGKSRVCFISRIGLELNILLAASRTSEHYFLGNIYVNTLQHLPLKEVNLSPFIGVGVNVNVTDNLRISVLPSSRFQVFSTYDHSYKQHLWSLGLNFGLTYRIGKPKKNSAP